MTCVKSSRNANSLVLPRARGRLLAAPRRPATATATGPPLPHLGAALDARWYGATDFAAYVREGLARLGRDEVNAAIRRHLSADDLSFVFVTRDAGALAAALLSDAPTTFAYDAPKPQELLDEDRRIGATRLGIRREAVRVTKVGEVFAR